MTTQEFTAKFNKLPALSKRIMATIITNLYAEAGFSDLTSDELPCSQAQWPGVCSRLMADDMISIMESDTNGIVYDLIYCEAHNYENEDDGSWAELKDQMEKFLEDLKTESKNRLDESIAATRQKIIEIQENEEKLTHEETMEAVGAKADPNLEAHISDEKDARIAELEAENADLKKELNKRGENLTNALAKIRNHAEDCERAADCDSFPLTSRVEFDTRGKAHRISVSLLLIEFGIVKEMKVK